MKIFGLLTMLILLALFSCQQEKTYKLVEKKPNILLIVADDLGYADIGAFGGDINTPNLDGLAAEGIRFSRFHTAPVCAVTRAMILSGNDNHIAGMGSQDLVSKVEGYEGHLTDRIIPFPTLLQKAGYFTFMAGKWHLGLRTEDNPHQKGFERSFVLTESSANHYSAKGIFPEMPISPYTEDGKETTWNEGEYSTNVYTDKLISYINQSKNSNRPFFGFASYTSPHWPLQVDEEYWKKYEGKFDKGYDSLKIIRFENLKKVGLIPQETVIPKNISGITPWNELTETERKKEARKMEIYAGMVENLDFNIGRLIQHLKETGEYENTLIIFMSDNGAAGNDFYYSSFYGPFLQQNYSDDYEDMGKVNSYISYGPPWAEAGSAPFRYFKGFTTEGGINSPMFISGPGVKKSVTFNPSFITILDLAPTFLELANSEYPQDWKGQALKPLLGESLIPLLAGKSNSVHDSTYVFGLEHRGNAMIRKGDWKIVNIEHPFDLANFQLINLNTDLAEQINLKETYPQKYQEMLAEWDTFSKEVGVIIPTPKAEND